jgi:hypothetical protein
MADGPGHSAGSHCHRDNLRSLSGWPAEGTAMEAEWSRATLDVVRRAWSSVDASLCWRPGIGGDFSDTPAEPRARRVEATP